MDDDFEQMLHTLGADLAELSEVSEELTMRGRTADTLVQEIGDRLRRMKVQARAIVPINDTLLLGWLPSDDPSETCFTVCDKAQQAQQACHKFLRDAPAAVRLLATQKLPELVKVLLTNSKQMLVESTQPTSTP